MKKLKETFKKLEIAIKQADQPKPSVPPNTPQQDGLKKGEMAARSPRRNLDDEFSRTNQQMGREDVEDTAQQFFKKLTDKIVAQDKNAEQTVKLQKYRISNFYGQYEDWTRFHNQFKTEVDNSKLPQISKFNYLMEYCKGKAKESISGLPYTEEGYEQAKAILADRFGRPTHCKRSVLKTIETLDYI